MIPKSINILGQKWKIIQNKKRLDSKTSYGECHTDKKLIILNEEINEKEKFATLQHEICHALLHQAGVRFSGGLTAEIEEIICESFANFIIQNKTHLKKILK